MSRTEYKVGDILSIMDGVGSRIVKITKIEDREYRSNGTKVYKRYCYKVLEGEPDTNYFFESGCLLWTGHKIKRVPLLKAKLYE